MLEVFVGFIILITPYLVGCTLNILAYGFSFEYWEGVGWTYMCGIFILMVLSTIAMMAYYTGDYVLSIIK